MLENERYYLEEDKQDMVKMDEIRTFGDYFAICDNGRAYYAQYSTAYERMFFCIPKDVEILGYIPVKEIKILKYIRRDSHSRPIYQDADGMLWKDMDSRRGRQGPLYAIDANNINSEPLFPLKLNIRCNFIPGRAMD